MRTGEQSIQDIIILSQRTSVDCNKPPFINALRLYPTRKQCRQYNFAKLNELAASNSSEVTIIEAIDTTTNNDTVPKNLVPTDDSECGGLPHTLSLVAGARSMHLRNIMTTEGLVNGAQGTIDSIVWSQKRKCPLVFTSSLIIQTWQKFFKLQRYLPYTRENRKFKLENQMVRAIQFGKLQKVWAVI